MTILVVVSSIEDVPPKIRPVVRVLSPSNWSDVLQTLTDYSKTSYLFLSSALNPEILLKFVEEFPGSLVMYVTSQISIPATLASRFVKIVNKVSVSFQEFPVSPIVEKSLKLKSVLRNL